MLHHQFFSRVVSTRMLSSLDNVLPSQSDIDAGIGALSLCNFVQKTCITPDVILACSKPVGGVEMKKQVDRLEAARTAAHRVLAALPGAAESLDHLTVALETADVQPNVRGEALGISIRSVEQLADGFREVVRSLENGKMGKEIAASLESSEPVYFADTIENAATSIQSFISSIEAAGASDVDDREVLKLGELSGAAELMVRSLEKVPTKH